MIKLSLFLIALVSSVQLSSMAYKEKTQPSPPPVAQIYIKSAYDSNVKENTLVNAGIVIGTGNRGHVEASVKSYGVNLIKLGPNSQLQLLSSGSTISGGRSIIFNVRGRARFYTKLTNPFSEVKACLGEGIGCAKAYSDINIKQLPDNRYVVATAKGNAVVQDEEQKLKKIILAANEYSIMEKKGKFSLSKKIDKNKGLYILHQTKSAITYKTVPGYTMQVSNSKPVETAQIIIGTPFKLFSPLE